MYNNSIWKYNGHGYPHIYFPQYIYFKKCVVFFLKTSGWKKGASVSQCFNIYN